MDAAAPTDTELKLRELLENTSDLVFTYDLAGRIVSANPATARVLGYRREELATLEVARLIAPEHLAAVREAIATQIGSPFATAIVKASARDGRQIALELRARLVHERGRPVAIACIGRDVASPAAAATRLQESEERYALAARGANDGLWDWDLRSGAVYFSPRWKAMLGIPEERGFSDAAEWLGRVHTDDRARVEAALAQHLEARTPHLEVEHRMRHDDGGFRWMLVRGLAVREEGGRPTRIAGSLTDITDRKVAEEKLLHDALHDGLTGLPNRSLFMDRLSQAMAFERRRDGYRYAVLFLDIDRFKTVNESLGHFQGDRLLVAVARRLTACVRDGDTVARLGGDEFVILLADFPDPQEPLRVAKRIHDELAPPHDLDGNVVFATASIGVAMGDRLYQKPVEILRDADTAMYRAKDLGRAHHVVFQPSMHARARQVLQLEADLRRAIDQGELHLTYQPVISLSDGAVAGCEALCAWEHPSRGAIQASEFIPVAEETGLIVPLGEWVLREACRAAKAWTARLPGDASFSMAVNISARQLLDAPLIDHVRAALEESGLRGPTLRLEVTESMIMEHAGPATLVLNQLRSLDVHLLLDDFGTGYSSLGYLHNFRFDTLKIDRSFVSRSDQGGRQAAIVRTIVGLARALGMEVVAEGVETSQQVAQLQALGCDFGQGFYFSRPIPADAFGQLLSERRRLPLATMPPPIVAKR
ncbi:MAG: EAL domain-containing protein [Myxococcales bacterium]